jgi:glycosyltransferase involved in cell wall biosynthesis
MTSVSVVIPVYNHEAFVGKAIRSVAEQTYSDVEVICVDDGSQDGSIAAIHQTLDETEIISQFVAQENQGAHAALNRGASLARGDLLLFLNSDDLFPPDRAREFVDLWARLGYPDEFWAFSSTFFIDDQDESVDPDSVGVERLSQYTDWVKRQMWVDELFAWHNVMLTSGNLVVPRSLFERVGGFAGHRMVHDWGMALRLLAVVPPVVVTRELYGYRLHVSNTFRSIANDDAVRESAEVRTEFQRDLSGRVRTEPYSHRGIPFVDYLRLAVPMKAGSTTG